MHHRIDQRFAHRPSIVRRHGNPQQPDVELFLSHLVLEPVEDAIQGTKQWPPLEIGFFCRMCGFMPPTGPVVVGVGRRAEGVSLTMTMAMAVSISVPVSRAGCCSHRW